MATWPSIVDELVRTHRAALVGYAALFTGDLAAAEDLVHDALVKVFSRARSFSHANQAEAYVRRAIVSVFIDGERRQRRFRAALPVVASEATAAGPDAALDLDRALAALSPRLRAVVVLRFVDDLTVPHIAQRLRLAEGTVKRYLHEATTRLAVEYLEEPLDVPVVAHGERKPT